MTHGSRGSLHGHIPLLPWLCGGTVSWWDVLLTASGRQRRRKGLESGRPLHAFSGQLASLDPIYQTQVPNIATCQWRSTRLWGTFLNWSKTTALALQPFAPLDLTEGVSPRRTPLLGLDLPMLVLESREILAFHCVQGTHRFSSQLCSGLCTFSLPLQKDVHECILTEEFKRHYGPKKVSPEFLYTMTWVGG